MWSLRQTLAPTVEPVTLEELKDHLRGVSTADEDALLQSYLCVAREAVEVEEVSRALLTQTLELRLDGWPWSHRVGIYSRGIRLPRPPLQSVSSIAYIDANGATQTLDAALYTVDPYVEPGRIVPAYGVAWPNLRAVPACVTVTYVAGWTDRGKVPERIRHAIKLLAGELYENREAATAEAALARIPTYEHLLISTRCVYDFGRDCR